MKKTAYVSAKISPELKQRLVAYARKQDRTVSWQIVQFVEEGLERATKRKRPRSGK